MPQRRFQFLVVALLIGLAGLDGWAFVSLSQSRDQANAAQLDTLYCKQMVEQIAALRTRPTIAGSQEQAEDELARRIESAVKSAGLGGDDIASIAPSPPARVADSAYLEKATTVQLRQASLPQLIDLIIVLTAPPGRLQIKSLRLSALREKSDTRNWGVELTVTYLIYAPTNTETFSQSRVAKGIE